MTGVVEVGPLLSAAFTIIFIGWVFWAAFRRKRRPDPQVQDQPVGAPYRVWTTEFDRVVWAREANDLLLACDGFPNPTVSLRGQTLISRQAAVERISANMGKEFDAAQTLLEPTFRDAGSNLAISLLIDQSGSMAEKILFVAATIRWLSELCDRMQISLAISGFTSLGWHGGAARRKWLASGKPSYPGRLCALLHIRYREFGRPLSDDDWREMVNPNVLRENVDGEAIEWAAEDISRRTESEKLLIVLSDGAPVDDSTLMENGPSFLVRHLKSVIERFGDEGGIKLGAVGIGYRVSEFYPRSTESLEMQDLPIALAQEICSLRQFQRGAPV